jgi:hypothetical protein
MPPGSIAYCMAETASQMAPMPEPGRRAASLRALLLSVRDLWRLIVSRLANTLRGITGYYNRFNACKVAT